MLNQTAQKSIKEHEVHCSVYDGTTGTISQDETPGQADLQLPRHPISDGEFILEDETFGLAVLHYPRYPISDSEFISDIYQDVQIDSSLKAIEITNFFCCRAFDRLEYGSFQVLSQSFQLVDSQAPVYRHFHFFNCKRSISP